MGASVPDTLRRQSGIQVIVMPERSCRASKRLSCPSAVIGHPSVCHARVQLSGIHVGDWLNRLIIMWIPARYASTREYLHPPQVRCDVAT